MSFNDIGSEITQKIFENLTVVEISKLCHVNHSFNSICEKESLWKNKVQNDYEVGEKIKETWREEAKVTFLQREKCKKTTLFWNTQLQFATNEGCIQ
uniref:F-box-like family protein n=1 Tax=Pithovirus LCPAC403 TaxID=2506596 RepID=A0A481ZD58_9VIRU|nr:MAG: F-box-like family protein [Pithovirus LCPAC403]